MSQRVHWGYLFTGKRVTLGIHVTKKLHPSIDNGYLYLDGVPASEAKLSSQKERKKIDTEGRLEKRTLFMQL